MVLRSVGVVDAVVDRSVHRIEGDLLRHAGSDDPPRLLPRCGLVPTRVLPVVAAHVEGVVDRDGPNPRRGAVRPPVRTERCDVQVICLSDLAQLVFWPCDHCGFSFETWHAPAGLRSLATTWLPSTSAAFAISAPIPRVAPVMNQTFVAI